MGLDGGAFLSGRGSAPVLVDAHSGTGILAFTVFLFFDARGNRLEAWR